LHCLVIIDVVHQLQKTFVIAGYSCKEEDILWNES